MSEPRARNDFIQVRLTDAGRAFAGKSETLRVNTLHLHFVFTGTDAQEVLRHAEWRILAAECDAAGKPLFEQIPTTAAAGSSPAESEEK